jgi:hypothetical protein
MFGPLLLGKFSTFLHLHPFHELETFRMDFDIVVIIKCCSISNEYLVRTEFLSGTLESTFWLYTIRSLNWHYKHPQSSNCHYVTEMSSN